MGYMPVEKTVAIIEAVKPETEPKNYWWMLLIAIIPPLITGTVLWMTRKYGKEFK